LGVNGAVRVLRLLAIAEAKGIILVLHYREHWGLGIKRKPVCLNNLDRLLDQQIGVVMRLLLKEITLKVIRGKRVASQVIVLNHDLLDDRNVISIRRVERLVRVTESLGDI